MTELGVNDQFAGAVHSAGMPQVGELSDDVCCRPDLQRERLRALGMILFDRCDDRDEIGQPGFSPLDRHILRKTR